MYGVVYKSTGKRYFVKSVEGILYQCRIRGKFRLKGIKSTNPIAVGDRVHFDLETTGDEEMGIITSILERENYIVRKSVNLSKQTHIIASNIDLAFLLITIDNPPTPPTFIDRFLVNAQAYSIPVILVFNKIDTHAHETKKEASSLKKLYESIGYKCVEVSAIKNTNLEIIKDLMKGKTSVFSGHSGVGKTTLLNAIEPLLNLKTSQLSDQYQQGKHTTTFAEMFDLSFDAKIIDTPGIKGFGIVAIEKEELGDYFTEFFALKEYCKFHNCMHLSEPQCAVKEAIAAGEISRSRYKSYLQILAGEEASYRTDIWE